MTKKKDLFRYSIYLLMISFPLLFNSCYPGGMEYYNESDIVLSMHDESFDFQANKKYFMADTVYIAGSEDIDQTDINHNHDATILGAVATQLDAAGYTRIEPNGVHTDSMLIDSANVLVSIVITRSDYGGIGYIPGGGSWWGYYPGWGYDPWNPWYPWYPDYGWGVSYVYTYSTGSLFIEMANTDGIEEVAGEPQVPLVWQATVNGLLSENTENMTWRIEKGIEQCFEQSPYLQ